MDGVVHFEIPAAKVDRAKKFYAGVFDWKLENVPNMDYVMVQTTERDEATRMPKLPGAINGGMMKKNKTVKSPVITIAVENIDTAMEKAKKAGGRILGKKIEVMGMGWSAYFKDTEGNVMGLWQNMKK